jgi:drug/metabolite transporter (DMT)-like permease
LTTPYLLTALHATASIAGTSIFLFFRNKTLGKVPPLSLRYHISLGAFSSLYTVNIAISNLSLSLVSLPLHQTIRAIGPAITIFLSYLVIRQLSAHNRQTYYSLIPIILGVVLATCDSYNFSRSSSLGILLTFFGAFLAAFKTVVTNRFQATGSVQLSAPQLLRHLSPWAALQSTAIAYWNGEVGVVRDHFSFPDSHITRSRFALYLLCNCIGAFLLNMASFEANRRCGPLSIAVASNLKQVAILVISLWIGSGGNPQNISGSHIVGSLMIVFGGVWYAKSENQRTLSSKKLQSSA